MNLVKHFQFRFLGFLPILFCLGQAVYYWRRDEFANMLWMCNIGNFLLGIGIFFGINWLTRIVTLWMIPGLVIWLNYVVGTGNLVPSSFFAHIGGLVVGLYALYKIGGSRQMALHAIIWFFTLQLVCRVFTSSAANVNVAHRVHEGVTNAFNAYWKFWLTSTALVVSGMFVLQWILLKMFPEKNSEPLSTQAFNESTLDESLSSELFR